MKYQIETCPKCGYEGLIYNSAFEHADDEGFYLVDCPECDFMGQECYQLKFEGYIESISDKEYFNEEVRK